jgi:hypothetical protein
VPGAETLLRWASAWRRSSISVSLALGRGPFSSTPAIRIASSHSQPIIAM